MKYTYHPTALESWVSRFYRNLNIYTPEDLNEETIAYALDIYLSRKDISSFSYEEGKFKSITIDRRASPEEQREQFYHELCHILRHAGRQSMMPKAFRELQEWDARHFVRYAAIPYHMLRFVDFNDPDFLLTMAKRFGVTTALCQERTQKIKDNSAPRFIANFSLVQYQQK
jgi:Zn-dependent peptidase ImmA (M78 family)